MSQPVIQAHMFKLQKSVTSCCHDFVMCVVKTNCTGI